MCRLARGGEVDLSPPVLDLPQARAVTEEGAVRAEEGSDKRMTDSFTPRIGGSQWATYRFI
jgi:hypothetical protein